MNSAVLLLLLGVAMVASMAHQHHHHHHRSKIASAVSLEFCAQFYATLSEEDQQYCEKQAVKEKRALDNFEKARSKRSFEPPVTAISTVISEQEPTVVTYADVTNVQTVRKFIEHSLIELANHVENAIFGESGKKTTWNQIVDLHNAYEQERLDPVEDSDPSLKIL